MEKYIESICDKCGKKESVTLSDILNKKSSKDGLPEFWKRFGDYIDYTPSFLLCSDCTQKWYEHLQKEIEKFIIRD